MNSLFLLLHITHTAVAGAVVVPPWNFSFGRSRALCVNATTAQQEQDSRWVWLAVPDGPPPEGGFPIWISLVTDTFSPPPDADGVRCGRQGSHRWRKPFDPFTPANETLASWADGDTEYDQFAGALWNQRLKQHLVANGIAVLCVNPISGDSWDAGPWYWEGGADKPFLRHLFAMMVGGELGPLDSSRVSIRGYSSGAQMASWLMEVFAVNGSRYFPGVTLRGAVLLSGGTYQCYSDPTASEYPAQPIGSCVGCNQTEVNFCIAGEDGVDVTKCSTCNASVVPYCGQARLNL